MKNWIKYRLNEICIIGDGNHSSNYPKRDEMVDDGVPFIRGNNMVDGLISWNDMKFIKLEKHLILKKGHLKEGDILFTNRGEIGKIAIVSADFENANLNSQIAWLRCSEKIISKFLFYFLSSPFMRSYYNVEKSGAALQQFTIKKIREIPIFVPPLPEQQRIVSILDHCFEAIDKAKANAERNLQNAKELFESYLQGVLESESWDKKTLKEITTILGDGLHGTPKYTNDGDYYFINGNNLNDGEIKFKENTKRVNIDEFNKYKKNLNDRTILVSINGTLGNIAFYNGEKVVLGKSACYFNLKDCVDKSFVKYVLSSTHFLQYAHREATGATIKNVSLKTMREFKVPLPSIEQQQTIVQQLDTLQSESQKLQAHYQNKIDDLEELKKSILQKAFAGELKTEKMVEEFV